MEETLKTTGAGLGGFWISLWGWLPEVVSLSAGDVVVPAIQYVSGTSTIWYGSVTLLFAR